MASSEAPRGFIPALVEAFLDTRASLLLLLAGLCLGAAALWATPREEEPQIVATLADVLVSAPGAGAEEVEKLVATPLERLLWQIDGVEHVYSVSRRGAAMATVRFYVGQDREESLVKLMSAIQMHLDLAPSIVSGWLVKPVEIDDVPILTAALYSDRHGPHELRRMAEETAARLSGLRNLSRVTVHGGQPREIRVELSAERLAGFNVTALEARRALAGADTSVLAGSVAQAGRELAVRADSFLASAEEAGRVVVGVSGGRPVYLRDVAEIVDGPAEAAAYSRIGFSNREAAERGLEPGREYPAVTIALAKKKGTSAVDVSRAAQERLARLKAEILPPEVRLEITRDNGHTAQAKADELLKSLAFAVATVVGVLILFLGWREALVVAVSVPLSFALALFVNHLLGYTINRVTLFALILSLGIVVDDPIINVDNIQRHILRRALPPRQATLAAVAEMLPPVIMSTLAIVACFIPLFFITGMMGPYMAPMAANVPLTVGFSTVAALTVAPWLSFTLLRRYASGPLPAEASGDRDAGPGWLARGYRRLLAPFLDSPRLRLLLLAGILALLALSAGLALLRQVPLKMLPFDNKNELQVLADLPEGAPAEATDRAVRALEDVLRRAPEVTAFTSFTGLASPMDFNGLVRHYYLRSGGHVAEIRVNLADKDRRKEQSHAVALRLRPALEAAARAHGARLKLVETPPGPPVVSTITAEVYGPPAMAYDDLVAAGRELARRMRAEPLVVDVDTSAEAERQALVFTLDKEKAALHGVTAADAARTLALAVSGDAPANVHLPGERQPLPVRLVLPRAERSEAAGLGQLPLRTAAGGLVHLAELGSFALADVDQPIYHKNLERLVFAYAEMAGRAPGEAVLDLQEDVERNPLPPGVRVEWAGEGEWEITLTVFRDLGLAFGAALVGIFILLVLQTKSWTMPLLVMSAIPLTLIGIMPGFWLLNLLFAAPAGDYPNPVFFTATAMIGMIALGGIVIRNSLVLIEFIQDRRKEGLPLREAVLQSGAARMRPIMLTAVTTALGAWPITLDPIFSGLAWALIFGLAASTAFTLLVAPVAYAARE
ncbi:MAG: efflux RND transporter permease subunit, partial [Thermodesulfobacteriota bacterium]